VGKFKKEALAAVKYINSKGYIYRVKFLFTLCSLFIERFD